MARVVPTNPINTQSPFNTRHPQGHLLIGISGRAGAGKSALSSSIMAAMDPIETLYECTPMAFPLKLAAKALFGFSLYQLHVQEGKEEIDPFWGVTPRAVLQWLGTEVMRDSFARHFPQVQEHEDRKGKGFWISRHERELNTYVNPHVFLIPDIRFNDEADYVLSNGGILINITRPLEPGLYTGPAGGIPNHVSEAGINLEELASTHGDPGVIMNFYNDTFGFTEMEKLAKVVLNLVFKDGVTK